MKWYLIDPHLVLFSCFSVCTLLRLGVSMSQPTLEFTTG